MEKSKALMQIRHNKKLTQEWQMLPLKEITDGKLRGKTIA